MKKLLLYWFLIIGFHSVVYAQNISDYSVSTVPENCTASAPITIRFDSKNFDIPSKWGNAYVWIWINPGGNPTNQGSWNNTNEAFKMTRDGNTSIYTYTFTPSELWPDANLNSISEVGFLVKQKNGNGKSGDLKIALTQAVDPIVMEPKLFHSSDEVTMTVDSESLGSLSDWDKSYLWIWLDGVGNPKDQGSWNETSENYKLQKIEGTTKYKFTFTPTDLWPGISGEKMKKIGIIFKSKNGSKNTKNAYFYVTPGGFVLTTDISEPSFKLKKGTTKTFTSTSTEVATLSILVDNKEVKSEEGTKITYDFTPQEIQSGFIEIQATKNGQKISNRIKYLSYGDNVVEKLPAGSRAGISYPSETSARLVLYAPAKENVYVLGDFNDWNVGSDFQMKKDGDYYWLDIPNLESGKEYAFQYFIDGSILVADPYTDKILDPWNDSHISDETYPNLMQYPKGKTEGIVSVLQPGQTAYKWEVENFDVPKHEHLMIYELLVRDFDEKHSYQAIIDRLDYLENLNVNVLELMPINEFDGNDSWGYNPNFYFAPDKYYGPKNDLKRLIDACHKRGIAVVIDLVLNHSWGQSPFYLMYKNGNKPSKDNPWYNENHNFETPDAQWGEDFNHDRPQTRALVDSINSYWMSEYKVDGFRFDFTKGFSNNFKPINSDKWGSKYDQERINNLERMSSEIWKRKSDALVICEHLAEDAEDRVLGDFGMMLWCNMFGDGKQALMAYDANFSGADYKHKGLSKMNLIGYMESHDEERISFEAKKYGKKYGTYDTKELPTMCERLCTNGALFFLMPGPKMIWQFGELGYDYSIEENGRTGKKPIRWDYLDDQDRKKVYDTYAKFFELKTTEEIFATKNFDYSLDSYKKYIRLHDGAKEVVIVGNFDVVNQSVTVNIPTAGTWYNMMNEETMDLPSGNHSFDLKPGAYLILSNYKSSISTNSSELKSAKHTKVFPIPATDRINMVSDLALRSYSIYDILGNLVAVKNIDLLPDNVYTIPLNGLSSGVYFFVAETSDGKKDKLMFVIK
ncbi:T9SS type A sorting domain-containing protein [Halosquirtibacter laminarini]|uniref:T9SS type A sorting domain-containing protein n=1 Tax=Halosquirtibacter laminarini TaxID=3374600 RepID=A0AC61NNM5_9BACT|nr:T9SS type A sorting domain-containing protein [Prolixibacteraceae bacterium]